MDLDAARTELRARGASGLVSDARLTTFLNRAKNTLEDVWAWPWLEATTSGAAPLTISDLRAVLYVADTTHDCVLEGVDVRDVVRWDGDADPTTTGRPDYWWLDGLTTLKVWPVEAVNLSVRYVKYSPELSADSDTPLIPVRYHSVWVDLAMVEVYKNDDEAGAAQALQQDVNSQILQMLSVFGGRNFQNPPMTQFDPWAHEDS